MTSDKREQAPALDPSSVEGINAERRAFFRNAALAAGAVSVMGATIGVAEAQAAPTAPNLKSQRKLLKASFDGNHRVSIEHVYAAVEQLLDIAGCPTCGLLGFDLNLRVNPVERLKLEIPTFFEAE